jgi:hypothetical protein
MASCAFATSAGRGPAVLRLSICRGTIVVSSARRSERPLAHRTERHVTTSQGAIMRMQSILSTLALLGAYLAAAPALPAQSTPAITPNARVRVWAPPRAAGHEGTIVSVDSGAAGILVWRRAARARNAQATIQLTDTIPLSAVRRLEVRQRRSSGARTFGGALLGLIVGVPAGALLGIALQGDCSDSDCLGGPVYGGLIGGATGIIAGAAIGSRPVASWDPVRVPVRLGLTPVRGGLAITIAP